MIASGTSYCLKGIRRAVESYKKCLNHVKVCPSTLVRPLVPRMLHSSRQQYPALITTTTHAGSSARNMPHRSLLNGIGRSHTPAAPSAASLQHHQRPHLLLCCAQQDFCHSSTSNPCSSPCISSSRSSRSSGISRSSSSSTRCSSRSHGWVLGQHIQQGAGPYLQRQVVCAAFKTSSSSSKGSKTKSRYVCQECGAGEGVLREGAAG